MDTILPCLMQPCTLKEGEIKLGANTTYASVTHCCHSTGRWKTGCQRKTLWWHLWKDCYYSYLIIPLIYCLTKSQYSLIFTLCFLSESLMVCVLTKQSLKVGPDADVELINVQHMCPSIWSKPFRKILVFACCDCRFSRRTGLNEGKSCQFTANSDRHQTPCTDWNGPQSTCYLLATSV